MNIYISGISGTGMGPLALFAKDAGFNVYGSDKAKGLIVTELDDAKIDYEIGSQDGTFLKKINEQPQKTTLRPTATPEAGSSSETVVKNTTGNFIDWFVYTSALPADHPELVYAREHGIKCTKRDEFIAFLTERLNLKMVAVAGTHGKTTTTSMIIWGAKQLGLNAAYLTGTNLGFAKSGKYETGDEFLIYEADEYDRNFLAYHPWLSVIPFVSYDHPDIYPTREDYDNAFLQFETQSENVIFGDESFVPKNLETPHDFISTSDSRLTLAGEVRRKDATLALRALRLMICESDIDQNHSSPIPLENSNSTPVDTAILDDKIVESLNAFPGVGRRFEKLSDGIYTDYAHHPEEIKATLEIAKEEAERTGKQGIVVLYEPHQNSRQHEVKNGYKDAFVGADKIFWLPTYLTRENPNLKILTPADFIKDLSNKDAAESAELNDSLADKIKNYHADGYLILLLTAGPADSWLRKLIK